MLVKRKSNQNIADYRNSNMLIDFFRDKCYYCYVMDSVLHNPGISLGTLLYEYFPKRLVINGIADTIDEILQVIDELLHNDFIAESQTLGVRNYFLGAKNGHNHDCANYR